MKPILFTTILCFTRIALAQDSPSVGENKILHQRLGDEYAEHGDFTSALDEYGLASEAAGDRDVELLKRIATLHQWERHFTEAGEWLGKAIAQNPSDAEAKTDLDRLHSERGLQFLGGYGGGEIDFTRNTYAFSAFYGGVDWLDLHAGYSRSDKLVYDRSNSWVDAYLFPEYNTYVRLGLQLKEYTYPRSINMVPDNNAYSQVPDYQVELGHYYYKENYVSLEFEYFTPNFFWNSGLRAKNFKLGATVRNWIVDPIYAKLFAATLHDPYAQSFIVEPATNVITGLDYENLTLIGGALGFDDGKWNVEFKYVPDRDLDRSLDWSLFSKVRYNTNTFSIQYDLLYDRYPLSQLRDFSSSQAHMVTVITEPAMFLELRTGMKALVRNTTTLNPFVSIRIRTGV